MSFSQNYINECIEICKQLNPNQIEDIALLINSVRDSKGRIFFLELVGEQVMLRTQSMISEKYVELNYAPTDNVSELTARVNDDGWDTCYENWLKGSNLNENDMLFVFSVGGGNLEKNISVNILKSLQLAKSIGAKICGVVGRDGGYTKKVANACIVVPTVNDANITPHTEAFQAVVWHLLVAHPLLLANEMKWESVK